MNIRNIHIFQTLAALLLCVVAGSCSQTEFGVESGETLPPGKYPLMLTASIDKMTSRADEKELWGDGDVIAVRIGDYPVVGNYTLNVDGSVKKADEPLSWPFENGFVKAWYPYVDLNKTMTLRIDDQSNGYHNLDFMNAVTEKEENFKNTINLNFKHQMAKVCCKLFKGEGVTDEDLKTAKVSFYGFTTVTFSEQELSGKDEDWITPTSSVEALLLPQDMAGKPFIKVDLTVTVNSTPIKKTLIYTPEEGKVKLEAGTFYTFNITVKKDRLVAETISGQWNDVNGSEYADEVLRRVNLPKEHGQTLSFSSNVTPVPGDTRAGEDIEYLLVRGKEFTISYEINDSNYMQGFIPSIEDADKITMNCSKSEDVYLFTYKLVSDTVSLVYDDYVQVGDIYYSDDTWSRSKIAGKIPIGIVFRAGAAGTDDIPDYYDGWDTNHRIRGYVVALEDASPKRGCWANSSTQSVGKIYDYAQYLTTTYEEATALKDGQRTKYYSGYVNTNKVRTENPYGLYSMASVSVSSGTKAGVWAFKVAVEYHPANIPDGDPAAPSNSSGWYLPSIRQLIDISNVFRINKCINEAGGAAFDNYSIEYWSSSEFPYTQTQSTVAYSHIIAQMKTNNNKMKPNAVCYVRSVLTF